MPASELDPGSNTLLRVLRSHAPAEVLALLTDDLEASLTRLVSTAEAAYPAVRVPPLEFVTHLARRLMVVEGRPNLSTLHAADLRLACGCLRHDSHAVAELVERLLPKALRAVGRLADDASVLEDLRMNLAEELLVGRPGHGPELESYSGRGSLSAWLAGVALHAALNLRRANRTAARALQHLGDQLAELGDVEVEYIRNRYREDFRVAFELAQKALSDRERTLLKLHVARGMRIEKIAACYHVHASSVSRWLTAAREKLLAGTKAHLQERLHLEDDEAESLLRLLRAEVELSLGESNVTP